MENVRKRHRQGNVYLLRLFKLYDILKSFYTAEQDQKRTSNSSNLKKTKVSEGIYL